MPDKMPHDKPSLVVLAAGIGSRYGGLKQIDPMGPNGEIVLDYSLYDAWKSGFGKVVFVIREELEAAFRERFKAPLAGRLKTAYAFQYLHDLPPGHPRLPERQKPWGTGQALWAARHEVKEPFAVINADDFYGRGSYQALDNFLAATPDRPANAPEQYAMVGFQLANTLSPHGAVSRGICETNHQGQLLKVTEHAGIQPDSTTGKIRFIDHCPDQHHSLKPDAMVSMNMWAFQPTVFARLQNLFTEFLNRHNSDLKAEFYLPAAVDTMIQRRHCQVQILKTPEKWFGVTYREDKPQVASEIQDRIAAGVYPSELWSRE